MTVFIFGEAMLEYHSQGGSGLRYGGDTLNTAIHLARLGHDVAYVTALGIDPISDALVAAWQDEGIDTRFVLRHPARTPGIYAIHLDDHGERSFLYWRDQSAAREMFDLDGMNEAIAAAAEAKILYFSLITLAIVGDFGREQLFELSDKRRAAGLAVAYDSNFRPALWRSIADARAASERATGSCSIGLPTNNDERHLWQSGESDTDIAKRWHDEGRAVVLKAGESGCVLMRDRQHQPEMIPAQKVRVVDTSGAGDAFNAGFLSCYLSKNNLVECVAQGQSLAQKVIGKMGAIPVETPETP